MGKKDVKNIRYIRRGIIPIIGKKYNHLVLSNKCITKNGHVYSEFLCDCGKIKMIQRNLVVKGIIKSCGCIRGVKRRLDLIGKKYGRLKVIRLATPIIYPNGEKAKRYHCKCDCGKEIIVRAGCLTTKHTTSCGCVKHERIVERNKIYVMKKENHPLWNDTFTEQDRINRRSLPENKIWNQEVKKRDNYICQICGNNQSGKLVSHHISSYKRNSDLRFDIKNGVTLCRECHLSFHINYGFRYFEAEEFIEFKNYMKGGIE